MADLSQIPTDQLLTMLHGGDAGTHPATAPQQSPQDAAFAAGRQTGQNESPVMAGAGQFAQQFTPFGIQNYVQAAARYAAQRAAGVQSPDDYNTDLAYSRGNSQGEVEGHPLAATLGGTVGGMGGALAGGKVIGSAVRGAQGVGDALGLVKDPAAVSRWVLPATKQVGQALTTGQKAGNIVKTAALGGLQAASQASGQGQDDGSVALAGGAGALLSPAFDKGTQILAKPLTPVAQRAWGALADAIHEDPDTILKAAQSHAMLTGALPQMADLMDYHSQGALRQLAAKNPIIADAAKTAEAAASQPLHIQLTAAQNATRPQTASDMIQMRNSDMDAAMDTPHPQTGVALRDTPITDPNDYAHLNNRMVDYALQPNTRMYARLGQTNPVLDNIRNGTATLDDVEAVRKGLRDVQGAYAQPPIGATHMRDPALSKAFGDLANKVEGVGTRADGDYGKALNAYRFASDYSDGFQHGLGGNPINDTGGDARLQAAFNKPSTALGNPNPATQGYQHGNALYTAQQALRGISPGSVRPPAPGVSAANIAQGAMAATSGPLGFVAHLQKAIPSFGKLPDKVQNVIVGQLYNPRTIAQGIANLQRGGVNEQDIKYITSALGQGVGGRVANSLTGQAP